MEEMELKAVEQILSLGVRKLVRALISICSRTAVECSRKGVTAGIAQP